jgi:methionyl-tRNA formyltransferase
MPDSNDRFIRWQMGVEQIDRICRAFGKFSAFAVFEDRLWNVYDLTAWQQVHNDIPGTKVHITNTETIIAASDGYVCLRYFQACEDPTFQQLLTEQIT